MEDKEIVIKAIYLMEELGRRLTAMELKFEAMNNDKIQAMDKGLAVQQEKTNRLEKVVYGLLAIAITQAIAFVFLWLQNKR